MRASPPLPLPARDPPDVAFRPSSSLARCAASFAAALAMAGCGGGNGASDGAAAPVAAPPPAAGPVAAPPPAALKVTTVAKGLDHPWGLAFLPDFATSGRLLVTERPGRLRVVMSDGSLKTVSGLPEVLVAGQGGLFDIVLDPAFATNRTLYWSYAEAGSGSDAGKNGLAVARGVLDVDKASLSGVQVILRQTPKVASEAHFGGRLAFGGDGLLFVTMGERQLDSERGYAQDLSRDNGKVARIRTDGSVPPDNPFVGTANARPEIWSLGHRNPQGAAINPATGALWVAEHGPQGGDEINIVQPGKNYGWPLISYGCEYGTPVGSCAPVGGASSAPGLEQPLTYWVPTSTAPSGLMFYTGDAIPEWKGKAFTGALAGKTLWRLDIDRAGAVVCTPPAGQSASNCAEVDTVKQLGRRIRDVRQGPDGWVYLLTDDGGDTDEVLRLQH